MRASLTQIQNEKKQVAQWFLRSGLKAATSVAVLVTEWLVTPGPTWRTAGCLPASWAGEWPVFTPGSRRGPRPLPPPQAGTRGPGGPSLPRVCVEARESWVQPLCTGPDTGGAAGQVSLLRVLCPPSPQCPGRAPAAAFESGCQEKEGAGSAGVISVPDGSV